MKTQKNNYNLTPSEEELMGLFWTITEPMSSIDILIVAGEHSWNDSYRHLLLRSLVKKEMIQVYDFIQYGSQYARRFVASITKEKYMIKFILSRKYRGISVAKTILALIKEELGEKAEDDEYVIKELEETIKILYEMKKNNQST